MFKSAYSDVICKWRSDGLTDTEIIDRLNKNTVNNSMNALLKQAAKDYYEYFVEKRFEISNQINLLLIKMRFGENALLSQKLCM